jgi:hypothetical protein
MVAGGLFLHLAMVTQAPASDLPGCLRALAPLGTVTVVTDADFAPADCGAEPLRPAFRYDRAIRAVRLARDVSQGELVPALPGFQLARVRPGSEIFLTARVGGASVRHRVKAVTPGTSGGIFVRTADGVVHAAPPEVVE